MNTTQSTDKQLIGFGLFIAVVVYGVFGIWLLYTLGFDSNALAKMPFDKRSEVVRNIVLGGIAFVGFPLAIWRSWIAKRQLDRSTDQVEIANESVKIAANSTRIAESGQTADRFQKGMQMLDENNVEMERIAGVITLEHLARDHPNEYRDIVTEAFNGIVSREVYRNAADFGDFEDLETLVEGEAVPGQAVINHIVGAAARSPLHAASPVRLTYNLGAALVVQLELYDGNLSQLGIANATFARCRFKNVTFPNNFFNATVFRSCGISETDFDDSLFSFCIAEENSFSQCNFWPGKHVINDQTGPAFLEDNNFYMCNFSGVSFEECGPTNVASLLRTGLKNWAWDDRPPTLPHGNQFPEHFLVDHRHREAYEASGARVHPSDVIR